MNVSFELGIGILINVITLGVTIGVFVSKINLVLFRIEQLERKQDKYNGMQERLGVVETKVNGLYRK
jgi:Na+-transporting NADH:ubiquinone oxidoreductase subunit NqrC